MAARIRKDDTVMVIAGRDRGKTGKVLRVMPDRQRALVERLNLVKRHMRATGPGRGSGIVEKEAGIHLSNLMVLCDKCDAPVRTRFATTDDGKKVRVCRRCGERIDR